MIWFVQCCLKGTRTLSVFLVRCQPTSVVDKQRKWTTFEQHGLLRVPNHVSRGLQQRVLGGPHSQKGAVAEHLVKRCGLVLISLETLLMRYLAATAKHPSFRETLDLIEAPDITLTWEIAMDLLLNEIRRSKSRFILVDLIPNMNKLLRCASLFHNAAKTFAQYDHEELHCRFAVHLIDEVAVATKTSKASSTTNADEMNPAFKKKRSVAFTSRVGPLLKYTPISRVCCTSIHTRVSPRVKSLRCWSFTSKYLYELIPLFLSFLLFTHLHHLPGHVTNWPMFCPFSLFSASQRLVTIKRISPGGEVEGELVAYLKHWSEYRIVSKSFDKQLPQPQQRGRVIWNI
eukprot:m.71818 g.71818  ORF g.71818 m.71818 type:complete len:344 (-) comp12316_c0_seq5:172-1203(-)